MPTKECRSAISSGMPVISTSRARQMPMPAPITIAPTSRTTPTVSASSTASTMVATRAMVMPAMP